MIDSTVPVSCNIAVCCVRGRGGSRELLCTTTEDVCIPFARRRVPSRRAAGRGASCVRQREEGRVRGDGIFGRRRDFGGSGMGYPRARRRRPPRRRFLMRVYTCLVGDDGGFDVEGGTFAPLHGARGAPFEFAVWSRESRRVLARHRRFADGVGLRYAAGVVRSICRVTSVRKKVANRVVWESCDLSPPLNSGDSESGGILFPTEESR